MGQSRVIAQSVDDTNVIRDLKSDASGALVVTDAKLEAIRTLLASEQVVTDGNVVQIVHDPQSRRLLEEILIELRVLNAQFQQSLTGNQTGQTGARGDLRLAL